MAANLTGLLRPFMYEMYEHTRKQTANQYIDQETVTCEMLTFQQ